MASKKGQKIEIRNRKLVVPDNPIIPFIRGDGTGPDIWNAAAPVLEAAVKKAYKGERKIIWKEILAGELAHKKKNKWLPKETVEAIAEHHVAIKGPLTTPVGGGIRSLNVTLRQTLKLYACVRPVKYIKGVPAPVKSPEKVDMVIFRENMEDVYAGIEWKKGTKNAKRVIDYLNRNLKTDIPSDAGVGVKPISEKNTKNLVRMAIEYALEHGKDNITLMHKGNIMKFTEGAFRDWGYQLANKEFKQHVISEDDLWDKYDGKRPHDMLLIKDRIADAMFQQVLLRPDEYDVIATPNLNGDYISDALAAQVGGLGMAPGANIGDETALFEATHGTAPKYAGKDVVNPGSLILSGAMMLDHMGWTEAAKLVHKGTEKTIKQKTVTYDLERNMKNAKKVKCSQFGEAIVTNILK